MVERRLPNRARHVVHERGDHRKHFAQLFRGVAGGGGQRLQDLGADGDVQASDGARQVAIDRPRRPWIVVRGAVYRGEEAAPVLVLQQVQPGGKFGEDIALFRRRVQGDGEPCVLAQVLDVERFEGVGGGGEEGAAAELTTPAIDLREGDALVHPAAEFVRVGAVEQRCGSREERGAQLAGDRGGGGAEGAPRDQGVGADLLGDLQRYREVGESSFSLRWFVPQQLGAGVGPASEVLGSERCV